MEFETVGSQIVYTGRAFNVRRDDVRFPDGHIARLDIIEHPGAVVVVPVDQDGKVWFVSQYRHAVRQMLLELPAGTLESGEAPARCAGRELREEIGMLAEDVQQIGEFYATPGYTNEHMYVFLAQDLRQAPLPGDSDEYIQVVNYDLEETFAMLAAGQLRDAKTVAALSLARPYVFP